MSLVCDDPAERPGGAAEVLERLKKATGLVVVEEPSAIERHDHDDAEVRPVIDSVMDPLWASLLNRADLTRHFARFKDGEYLCHEGDASYEAFLLLQGKVRIERGGKLIEFDDREGTFIGELSTLTGTPRAASVQAVGTVWTCVFNAAEFERLLAAHPAVAIRLIKLMAERLARSK
jgi:CRP-like cAMP-binding protein